MTYLKSGRMFLLAALAAGCGQPDGEREVAPAGEGAAAAERQAVRRELDETKEAVEDYAWARKAELVDRLNQDLARIGEELDELSAEVEGTGTDATDEARAELQAVRWRWAHSRRQLEAVQSSTEESWSKAKGDIRHSLGELEDSWTRARARLSMRLVP